MEHMGRLGERLVAICVVLLIVVGCGSPPPYGVEIGMTEDEVIEVLGKPWGTTWSTITDDSKFVYMDVEDAEILDVFFEGGKVARVESREKP